MCIVYCRLTSSPTGEIAASSTIQPVASDRSADALSLAKQALLASKQAAAVAEELKLTIAGDDDPLPPGLVLALWLTLTSMICFFLFIGYFVL